MKIGEFALLNNVTAKILRHYDEIGLLKPSAIDPETSYRSYEPEQSHLLNWIIILKNLEFSLTEIKEILSGPVEGNKIVHQLIRKRIEITSVLNEQIQKKIAIDRLITIIEKEGFDMDKNIDLLNIEQTHAHEIKKNIPNMEMFLDTAANISALCSGDDTVSVFRFDISHFKQVNDDFGFDVGDRVIVACYQMIESNVRVYLSHAAIGRAHGDEFVVFAKADKEAIIQVAQSIIDDIKKYDFLSIGCPKQMGCYIGGLIGHVKNITEIRNLIESSIEAINYARKKGPNSITIEAYNL
ncbi:diguanylate cyclase domain-containing protein [Paenibacillus prosopidis]|uniref:Diguanylate cyclase (GGDEF)-like protein n=1 Tax=Paenibacillus prosopidis TaxID=630520 RepID=A0A368W389_9BACL|nr:diguanylate cyclase [Paenibacillus prosopidis]RCW48436.1 diguanylate cyclase (GGDEF)-like protein [Paenibacillus prosopidis]